MKFHGSLAIVVVLFVVGTMAGQDQPQLRQELLDRVEEDQAARKSLMEMWQKSKIEMELLQKSKKELLQKLKIVELNQSAIKKVMEMDRQNTAWLKEIVEKHGWPGKTLVGEDGAHAAWLLLQNAYQDVVFQKKCLDLMKEAVTKKEASAQDFAYLPARVLIAEKKKQIYGTQLTQEGDKLVPQPIEDEEHVDERRKEIGLQPLAEYLQFVEEAVLPKKEEKRE